MYSLIVILCGIGFAVGTTSECHDELPIEDADSGDGMKTGVSANRIPDVKIKAIANHGNLKEQYFDVTFNDTYLVKTLGSYNAATFSVSYSSASDTREFSQEYESEIKHSSEGYEDFVLDQKQVVANKMRFKLKNKLDSGDYVSLIFYGCKEPKPEGEQVLSSNQTSFSAILLATVFAIQMMKIKILR